MALDIKITDGSGKNAHVEVSAYGALAVGPIGFSKAYSVEASVINTGFNFVPPKAKQNFIVTDILLYANKNVGANDATVIIYEASAPDTATVDNLVLSTEMVKQTSRDLTGLNLIVSQGKWLNVKTDDASIFATVFGYYVTPRAG